MNPFARMTNCRDFVYDVEVLKNVFTCSIIDVDKQKVVALEISERKNDIGKFFAVIDRLQSIGARMVGFNNIGYDYPVIHYLLTELRGITDPKILTWKLYQKSKEITNTPFQARFQHRVWDRDQIVPQMDLYLIHHFDNPARATGLKLLEFNMRMDSIQEFECDFDKPLPVEKLKSLIGYNVHDIKATLKFYVFTLPMIRFREQLTVKYNRNFLNHNDTKIGKDFFTMRLEKELGKSKLYYKEDGKTKKHQTVRDKIALKDVIFPYVEFETPQFRAIKDWIESRVITHTKAVLTEIPPEECRDLAPYSDLRLKKGKVENLNALLDGVKFVFGTGGIHASIHRRVVRSNEEYVIIDLDVTSYYPSLAIENGLYPAHLGPEFCTIYADLKKERVSYPKGTAENQMLKLALNGVYGETNQKFSVFYDPQYTMGITINGQLLLCMLYEQLRKVPGLELIQVNTDGLTVRVPRRHEDQVEKCRRDWEKLTKLDLEEARYEMMHIRDVNNYIAVYEGTGNVKRKGTYAWMTPAHVDNPEQAEIGWHRNQSAMIIPRAASEYIVNGTDVDEFIREHDDDYDFMLRTKVPRGSKLIADYGLGVDVEEQRITRYYVATDGPKLTKRMPPLDKDPHKWRDISINAEKNVQVCNNSVLIDKEKVDYEWYISEARTLAEFPSYYCVEGDSPDWCSAPDWANFAAMDWDGMWKWFEQEPAIDENSKRWKKGSRKRKNNNIGYAGNSNPIGALDDWEYSLEENPFNDLIGAA